MKTPHRSESLGRRKINIVPIADDRSRQVTFTKRKNGLMKKAMELAVLCNCRIGLILFDGNGRLHDFTTEDMQTLVTEYFSKELYESNSKEELYRRYNPREAVRSAAAQALIFDDSKPDALSAAGERKPEEMVVDHAETSDLNNLDAGRSTPSPKTIAKIEPRKKLRSASSSRSSHGERSSESHDDRRVAVARGCENNWPPFAAQTGPYIRGATITSALDQGTVFNALKEEPYSAAQQVLRLEDNPAYVMSVPRDDGMYGMPVPSLGQECPQPRLESMFIPNHASTSCPVCIVNPEVRKPCDGYEGVKHLPMHPTLMPPGTGRMPSVRTGPQEGPTLPSQTFPFFDCLVDNRHVHLGGLPPFSVDATLGQTALNEAQQDGMCLPSLYRPNSANYRFPTSSHNSQT